MGDGMNQQCKLQDQLDWDHSWGGFGSGKFRDGVEYVELASKLREGREAVVIYLRGRRGRRAGG